ncbi:phosphoadenosine phosphosulfate reductase domain-containing protein [Luteibaculum oceani]|uniref:Phosphoadenylylsulfate reductase n=1 Tax=Luteibaculum oceani TaxID=1294296 RepID=A0A5C6VFA9_9FLAO|nr:phosphoadenosine phosphosulfate reductase family protein [Luteibaculum oceani]TXC81948.1 phosphoadenylylsulfate reductase [Luteibaculum oceani]
MNDELVNLELAGKEPVEIVAWVLQRAKNPIITTNFGPRAASLLHCVTQLKPDIPVVWIDTGYNTSFTYKHAVKLIKRLKLNIKIFVPKQTAAFRNSVLGTPQPDTEEHEIFTEQVKLEPFKRALAELNPDFWFTNLRKGQTALRNNLSPINKGPNGIYKICPFISWTDEEVDAYLQKYQLPSENRYYDPTKVFEHRECGLHKLN